MLNRRFVHREVFLFWSRFTFRTCEIICNHAARVLWGSGGLTSGRRDALEELNKRRVELQKDLNTIGLSHGQVCADCKGKCCGGVRERDAFIDRVLQDPQTSHLSARRKGDSPSPFRCEPGEDLAEAECVEGHCRELTTGGCLIPYERRPIQCTVYFCGKAVDELSNEECRTGIRAIIGLMKVQVQTVLAMLRPRPSRVRSRTWSDAE